MKKIVLTTSLIVTGALALGSTAFAQEWQGPYVGLTAGESRASDNNKSLQFDTNLDGSYGDTVHNFMGANIFAPGFCNGLPRGTTAASGCTKTSSRFGLGARAGYDWQMGHIVLGVVGDYQGVTIHDSVSGFSSEPNIYSFTRTVRNIAAIRGRLGYSVNHWLIYGTAGPATADISRSFVTSNMLNTFTAANSRQTDGFQGGVGVERKFAGRWSVGLEYLYTSIDDRGGAVLAGPSLQTSGSNPFVLGNPAGTNIRRSDGKFKLNTVLLSITYHFGR